MGSGVRLLLWRLAADSAEADVFLGSVGRTIVDAGMHRHQRNREVAALDDGKLVTFSPGGGPFTDVARHPHDAKRALIAFRLLVDVTPEIESVEIALGPWLARNVVGAGVRPLRVR